MLKAISCWALKDNATRSADSLFSEARQHGFEGIELAVDLEGLLTPETTEQDCKSVLEAARKAGIKISSLASGLGWQFPLSSDDPEVRDKGRQIQENALHIGSWLGVQTLLLVPGAIAPGGTAGREHVPYDVCCDRMKDGVARLAATAEQCGVAIGIENVWNRLLLSPLEMRDFIDSFSSEWVGAYLDVGNMIVTGFAEDWVNILGRRVKCVHFKDFKREVGTIEAFCDLLEGDVDYPAVMEGLRTVGYDGPCVAEFFGLEPAALAKLSSAMDTILAM